ncbi:hypothetical protein LAZ67_X000414 [Cordylochernes scorpioides]|uniref:Uncharacterized protein n=1 Tax=Cordylochernes scorpioides TaxID=51811 RepID=A0ABY6LU58_9ARAC|nr:hypothetical protein LAZ67_X000414 [Cordylochernes scorpioides]
MLKLGDDSRVSPSSDVETEGIGQRLLPEKKFETFADIESCVMVVWKTAKLWRDKTQRKRPRLHRPLTRLLNLEDFSPQPISLSSRGSSKGRPIQVQEDLPQKREIAELAKGRIVKQAKIARFLLASLMGLFASKVAFSKPTRVQQSRRHLQFSLPITTSRSYLFRPSTSDVLTKVQKHC